MRKRQRKKNRRKFLALLLQDFRDPNSRPITPAMRAEMAYQLGLQGDEIQVLYDPTQVPPPKPE